VTKKDREEAIDRVDITRSFDGWTVWVTRCGRYYVTMESRGHAARSLS
jgi:hypothetical protein